ncbi:hypothetical protein INR49_015936 [Caranx melampygus]|nr:hypothetical protein INR49_015936 [Caranx melampygus]
MATCPNPWLPWVTVRHEYIGLRSYQVSPSTSVQDVKQLLYEETDLPVEEQRLTRNGRVLDDSMQIGTLVSTGSLEVSLALEGRGLKGGGRFGQTTPPLVEFLKDILRRYPEGGQILKELIQNAEDAGATEVKFMYDETEYGVESLWSPDMAQHQATALYVYNDAVFTVEDWNGIQEIARSRKREDPLKVGRFGIGFNSVYHITDQIAMLDPHQTLFGVNESGQCWNLKTDVKEITELADQFAPYTGIFGSSEKTIKDGSFPGTLFRFPLRMKPSQLSGNIYNKEKVLELFESFKADADTVLLFLKSVQKISLHVRESDGTERMLFQVTATENTDDKLERPNALKTLGQAIDSYSNGVPSSTITCVTYQVNIETQDEKAKETQRTTWMVCNGVGGRGMCPELDSLADDLKFMPTIGIALPLTLINREDTGATSGFSGRAFCFLPLPPGEESETGLPVHVSGFFGLTDNRRSIKWREVDQWRDPAALWNELLVITVIPRAYFTLITETIKRVQTKKDQDFPLSPPGIYEAWPNPKQVKSRWKPILQPLFHDLLQQEVIYSLSENWIRVDQAVFSELDTEEDISATVINYLQTSGMQAAKVPAAVDSVLAAYTAESTEVRKVTPSLLRQVIRKYKHKGPSQEKLILLEFALGDANYSDLIGLELLPLQDDTFTTFSSSVNDKDAIYIASEECPRSLYPGLEGRFILENIKPSVMDSLKKAAKSRGRPCTQLQVLNPERSARLIKDILSTAWPTRDFIVQWEPGNRELKHPTISWLKMIWKHLYINFAEDLSTFEDMPLIPLVPLEESMDLVKLLRLKTPSPIILADEEEAPLSENLINIMEKLGGVVIKKMDSCLQHPLLKNYIHPSSPSLLLQIMDRMATQRLSSQVSSFSVKEKIALRNFLAGLPDITEKEKHTLLELSIFEKVGNCPEGTSAFTTLRGARALHHRAKYPPNVKLSVNLVGCSDEESIRLIKMLNIEQVKTTECLKIIIQDIERGFYATDEISQILLWALKHLAFLKNENASVIGWLSALKFIQLPSGKSVKASDLFDPELEILQNLFYKEEKTRFPPSTFTSSPDILHSVRQLGLRNEVQLSEKDVIHVAKKIEELQSSNEPEWELIIKKAKTLLQILNRQTKLVKSADAQTSLLKLKWVPVCKERPPTYPKSLAWVGDTLNICSLSEMCDISHAVLVGSSVALVEHTSTGMKKALKLTVEPQVDQVLQHLKAVNDWHKSQAFTTEDWYQFQQILFEIYAFMQAHLEDAREAMKSLPFDWVWTGKTFSSPGHTVLKPLPDLDLQPYLYSLPKTIRKFHKLFKFCGSVEEVVPSHVFEVISTIRQRCEGEITKEESKHDILLLINILRWLYNNQITVDTNMHVPILCYKDPSKLAMKPIHECTYCDIKVDDLNDLLEDASEPIILVHDDIPMKTAEWLKVPCLSTRLINPENLGFEQSGQREPLTVRIKNILEEYPSVADIFKELLQNADDAIYHITDIPIIMSREFMIMFDPNINHISKHIRDRSNPGIKINWSKQQKRLRKFPNQFKPFINVFNCQLPLAQDSPYKFSGTLFRLPFRTEQEASVSEISSLYYNTTDIYSLVDEFSICGHRFILFTQHVGSMVLKYLKYEEPNPAGAQDVVTINKSVWSSKASYGPLSILKSAARVMKKVASNNKVPADVPKSGCIIRVVVEEFHNVFKRIVDLHSPLFRGSEEDPNQYFEMAAKGVQTRRLTDEMPQKAVEVTNWLICSCMDVTEALKFSLSDSGKRLGLVPCGGVAVLLSEEENRKWIVKTNTTPIGEVFCYLPLRIKTGLPVHINGCFAVTSNRKEIWKTDTKGQWNSVFMRHVIVQAYLAALTMLHGKTWVSIKYVRFLDDALLCRPDIGPAAFKIFLKYLKKSGSQNLCAVELPDWVKEGFDDAGCKGKLMENTLTEKEFFSDVFFPHIQEIDRELRDPLMHYVLNEKLEDFASILRVTPCIPCSGPNRELVLPSRLIHPEGRVAKLYSIEDGRFPEGTSKDYLNPVCLVKLVQLGMVKDDLSWEDLIERAQSVIDLNESDHAAACFRSSILLSLIDEKLKMRDTAATELLEKLQDIKFLPFLTRPAGFSLPWHGNNFSPSTIQLKKLSQSFDGVTLYQENITNACYKYLHEEMLQAENAKEEITEELKAFNSILVENTYVNPSKVAFHLNFDAAPHLYQLPNKYRNSCRELFENVGVQPSFTVEDFSAVLETVKQDCGRRALTEDNFQLCRRIISEGIWSWIRDKNQEYCQANYGGILLPDSNLTLQPSKSLCYNDCPWIKVRDSSVKYCHGDIPREVAVKLGAIPKRHKALERYASNVCFTRLGSEFGQKEKLTSRIKSILNAYPSEKEMLKELLQNADDAKATEIYFVFDPRTHPTDRIFDDKWVPMQGPALCVYNNQPFTEDDIRGIQNLGRGTKEANPGKTGQYGIGFNSVYHITDCPSFISNNDILCIFDPHAQYAPGATSVSPGRMFRDLDSDFRSQFSDVLNLYLGAHFKLERSTMFRFPIRSPDMAKTSEISSVPASDRMVQNLLDKLKTDGAELLMFLNHMEKISICEIDNASGELKVLYSVTAKITDGDRLKRKQFHASVIDSVTKKKPLTAIPVQQITYTMDIEDTDGTLTTWMICNRSGFPNIENVSKSVISAHKNEDITLFPRGGVAACVSHNYKKPHRAFCFLPLSLETGLPFHVNGHFALDSARRNLWRDDNGVGVRSDWNNNLMTSLIAPACVELLIQLKRRYFPGPDPTMTVLQGTPLHVVKDTLRKYLFFFPVNRLDIQPDWYCLVKAVYNSIHAEFKRLLPVVRAAQIDNSDMHSVVYISWVNTSTANKGRAFFDNLLQDELQHLKNNEYNLIPSRKSVAENIYRLKTLLLDIGFNLVHSCDETANLYFCLQDAGIPVNYVTPEDVRNFLHTFSSPDTSCHVGKLPCRLQQSTYKLVHNLKILFDYCFKDIEVDDIKIDSLPLLLTMDNMLQVFDTKRPKFLTTHHELISSRKEMFMNTLYIKYSNILFSSGAAKVFDISSFGDLLGSVLPREYRTRTPVKWRDTFASESWLKNVWNFISENIAVKEDQMDVKPSFDTVLDILKDWALLPGIKFMAREKIVVPEHDVLLPLSLMNIAIFPHGQNDKVFHTLMKAGCIQLAVSKMCVKESPIVPFLAQYTANIENPSSVLKAVEYMIQTSAFKEANLTDKDFEALLLYFNCNLANLTQNDAQSLKLIPCFKSVSGRYISIANYGANYVLAKSIPTTDIDKWAHTASFAFLADSPQLKDLYTFLGCMPIDDLEIYLQHLLPKFENLSYDAKVEHIVYLKERLLSMEESCEIKDQLYEKLEGLSFIYDYSNRLRPTKFFYDETIKVFEVMLPAKSFIPSDFFKKVEQVSKPKNGTLLLTSWITFLRNIGLKYEISQQQVLQFAKEVSIKAQTESWTKEKVQIIVDVLLNHIFKERTDLFQGTFLKELSMIPFLCPERAPKELIRLHSQYQEMSGTLPLIRFSGSQVNPKFKQTDVIHLLWTSCPILPEKATPSSIKDQEGSTLTGQEQLDQVLNMLGVSLDPPLEKVISNCKNICNLSSPDDEMVKTRNKVLRSTYEFLNADKRDFRYQLRGVAFVMVEDGWKLLKPEEVVINLDNESDFKPYLYKLPLELGTFHQLFKLLGTEDVVSTKQYVEVLWRIYRNSEGKQLDPNEMRTVKRVVSGLFKSLHNDPVEIRKDLESLRDLLFYLPSHDGRLAKSSSLVFDDAPHYKSRIQGNVGVQMLVDMSQCYLGKDHSFHTKLIMLLPQKLRPRLLSSILEEQLDEDSPKMCQFGALCSLQGRLQLLLSSEQFITGLIRIMKHENDNAYLVNEEKAIRLCKALCEGLKVSCFEKLQTTLRVKGCSPIPHSRSETLAFLKRYGTAVIHLYIQHSDSKDINFLLALAMTLKSATDNLISDTSYLIAMLGCNDIYRITEKLDSLGVKYDSTEPSKLELPLPGTPIPAEIHHTLLMDPMNVFYPGEYVGYLVDSEGGDIYGSYQPTYTYAIIVQEVEREEEENTSFLGKCFQIDIGYSEYKIVSSLDLYKFSRQDESTHVRDTSAPSTPTSPDCRSSGLRMVHPLFAGKENLRPPPQKQSPKKIKLHALPEILKEVTLVVEQAWKLPETERKKIIRRLYLKWHPDKNAENLDIATEVFKHLQNEINRMEKQSLADQQNTDRASRRSFSTSSTRFQSEKFSFQRWLRQARANYSAARNDLHKNANEWVCFKCYLATKLALIAADYAVRGKSDKDVKPTALAQKVEEYNTQLTGLANDVQILEGYGVDSLRTRYPDLLPFPQIPNDRYTSEVAMRVMECTARIIIKLEAFVQQKI